MGIQIRDLGVGCIDGNSVRKVINFSLAYQLIFRILLTILDCMVLLLSVANLICYMSNGTVIQRER